MEVVKEMQTQIQNETEITVSSYEKRVNYKLIVMGVQGILSTAEEHTSVFTSPSLIFRLKLWIIVALHTCNCLKILIDVRSQHSRDLFP